MDRDHISSAIPEEPGAGLIRRDFLKVSGAGLAGASLLLSSPGQASAASSSYIQFNEHGGGHFSKGNKKGVAVKNGTLRLSNPMTRDDSYVGWLTTRPVGTPIPYDTLLGRPHPAGYPHGNKGQGPLRWSLE